MSESVQKLLAKLEPIQQRVVRRPLNEEALASLEKETGLPIPTCLREYFKQVGLFQDLTTGGASEYELFERAEEFPSSRKFLMEHFGKAGAELFPFAGDGDGNIIAAARGRGCDDLFFADHETLELKEVGSFCDWLQVLWMRHSVMSAPKTAQSTGASSFPLRWRARNRCCSCCNGSELWSWGPGQRKRSCHRE
jgi:hypothetical protein